MLSPCKTGFTDRVWHRGKGGHRPARRFYRQISTLHISAKDFHILSFIYERRAITTGGLEREIKDTRRLDWRRMAWLMDGNARVLRLGRGTRTV